ncbi:hypothetical protein BD626DRAFT_550416 [Schizophyllum amplum]|uniref:WW domain-containing protein n=1 Tax=Schizophyllum amplum TaxID=97359 RepID=A0A550C2Z9_9AGAR|nr:hypothetical protein BD626DRAFT_550416 [Auriculariopsis ampla]
MCAHSLQTEHRNPEGRTYWFNTGTRESVWEKPDDLKTPFEKALTTTKWKEYFSGGRKYYYMSPKWDMPEELLLLLEKVEKGGPGAAATPTTPSQITGPSGAGTPAPAANGQAPNANPLAVGAHTGGTAAQNGLPLSSGVLPARPSIGDDPIIPHNGFQTFEEGEKAFMHLLRKARRRPDVDLGADYARDHHGPSVPRAQLARGEEAAFEKFTAQLKAKEQEEKETRMAKLRPALRNMLKGNPNVFHYTTFSTADKLFAQHPIWQQARYRVRAGGIFSKKTRASRTRATQKQLNIDVLTRWRTAHKMLLDSEAWNDDPELQKLPSLDILLAFEDYARVTEREFEEQTRRAQVEKTRKERKAREGFRNLLQELVTNGTIKARSKWKEVYPVFKDESGTSTCWATPGSNPLELFWDSSWDLVKDDSEVKEKLSDEDLQEIYSTDDLRYALKKLPEPIDLNMSFEDAVPLMQHLPEYTSIADDGRPARCICQERLREAASEDGGSQSGRKRKEPMRDRDYDRDAKPRERGGRYRQADDYDRRYDRDYRSRHGGGHRDDRRDRRTRAYSRDWDEPRRETRIVICLSRGEEPIKYELDERADKRIKYEREDVVPARPREDTPEEGEI